MEERISLKDVYDLLELNMTHDDEDENAPRINKCEEYRVLNEN